MRDALADGVVVGGEDARAINEQFLDFKGGRQRLATRDTGGAGGGECGDLHESAVCGGTLLLRALSVGVLCHFCFQISSNSEICLFCAVISGVTSFGGRKEETRGQQEARCLSARTR